MGGGEIDDVSNSVQTLIYLVQKYLNNKESVLLFINELFGGIFKIE